MIQFKIIYNAKKRILKDGTALVSIRAYQNPKRKYISTEIYIKPDQWSKHLSKVIDHPNANEYRSNEQHSTTGLKFKKDVQFSELTYKLIRDFDRFLCKNRAIRLIRITNRSRNTLIWPFEVSCLI